MTDLTIGLVGIVALFVVIMVGVPIAVALIFVSVGCMMLMTDFDLTGLVVSSSAIGSVRGYIFAAIPMFLLMGALLSNSRASEYLYQAAHIATRRLRGGLAIATVTASAMFAAVTGISVASAAIFSRISVPEMLRHGYSLRLAVGSVGGSSILGALIPPSLLMILYGVLAEVSIGSLFIAGILPGVLLAGLYVLYISYLGWRHPEAVGRPLAFDSPGLSTDGGPFSVASKAFERVGTDAAAHEFLPGATEGALAMAVPEGPEVEAEPVLGTDSVSTLPTMGPRRVVAGALPVGVLVAGVIGGIWLGFFTPTESSAVGALGALVLSWIYGLRMEGLIRSFRETAATIGSLMLLLVGAQLYSRTLARSGVISTLNDSISSADPSPKLLLVIFVIVLVLLGAVLDSSSILFIMAPVMAPAVVAAGIDPILFGIIMIVSIEVGMLTPPFGIVVFSMSATLGGSVGVEDIFSGVVPFIVAMILLLALMIAFPPIATWLPSIL